MHTIIMIGAGLCLLGALHRRRPACARSAALAFVPLWLSRAAIDRWCRVGRVGHSGAEQAPIFVLVFAIPSAFALLVRRKLAP